MSEKKSDAIQLAGEYRKTMPSDVLHLWANDVVSELRRLHEVNADLLNAAKLFIKYDSNQDDGVGMMIAYNDAIEATKAAVKKSTKDTK